MVACNWILPLCLGIVATIALMCILFTNPYLKQKFNDLGALIQLETSRPVYYPVMYPAYPSHLLNDSYDLDIQNENPNVSYTSPSSDLLVPYPVYNYYPQNLLNPQNPLTNKNKSRH